MEKVAGLRRTVLIPTIWPPRRARYVLLAGSLAAVLALELTLAASVAAR